MAILLILRVLCRKPPKRGGRRRNISSYSIFWICQIWGFIQGRKSSKPTHLYGFVQCIVKSLLQTNQWTKFDGTSLIFTLEYKGQYLNPFCDNILLLSVFQVVREDGPSQISTKGISFLNVSLSRKPKMVPVEYLVILFRLAIFDFLYQVSLYFGISQHQCCNLPTDSSIAKLDIYKKQN